MIVTTFLSRIALTAAAIILCAASAPPNGGTISIEPITGDAASEPAALGMADGVSEALGAHGFTMLSDPGHSAYVAEVTLSRTGVGTGSVTVSNGRAAVAPGLFGAAGGGITVPLSAGHTRSVALERFQLELRIRKRGSGTIVWHGVAVTVRALDGRSSWGMIASMLSEAVLRSYPYEPQGTVSVP